MYFFVQPLKSQYPDTNSPSLGPGSSLGEKGEKNPHGRKQSKPGGSQGGGGCLPFSPSAEPGPRLKLSRLFSIHFLNN